MTSRNGDDLVWTCRSCGRAHVYRLKNICDCYFDRADPTPAKRAAAEKARQS